MKWSPECKRCL